MAGLEIFANQAMTTVSAGGTTALAAGTTETWTVASSSGFPAASSSARPPTFFRVEDPAASSEVIAVTNVSGTTWTVTRGAEGTAPVAHSTGFTVKNVVTAAALESMVQSPQVFRVYPSGDPSGATDADNISEAIAALYAYDGGTVKLSGGLADWNILCGVVTASTGVLIDAEGCWINARGAGDVFRFVDASAYSGRQLRGGGVTGRPMIDGTHTAGSSCAVHAGDILGLQVNVRVQNFTAGTTSKGVWFDNQNYWTEQLSGRISAQNCTQHVVFDVSGTPAAAATGSYDRADLEIYIAQQGTGNDGVVFQNGTYIIDGKMAIRGNFNGASSAPPTAVLRLTGSAGGTRTDAGQYSRLVSCHLDVGVECNTVTGSTSGPYSIYFGSPSNQISACYGVMDFGAAGDFFQASNGTQSNFTYIGPVTGDAVLAAIPQTPTNPLWLTALLTLVSSGNALVASTDGTAAAGGAIVLSPQSDTRGFIGIYSSSLGAYAYMVPNVANAHWAPSFGGAGGKGFGILGSSASTGAVTFGVLNYSQAGFGLGNAEFTVYDNGTVVTLKNTLDDGNGNSVTTGVASQPGGTDTSGTAAYTAPVFTSGTARQLSTSQDVMLYVAVKTSVSVTLSVGPTSSAADSILPATTMPVGAFVSVRVPRAWYVKLTCATMADLQLSQVTC